MEPAASEYAAPSIFVIYCYEHPCPKREASWINLSVLLDECKPHPSIPADFCFIDLDSVYFLRLRLVWFLYPEGAKKTINPNPSPIGIRFGLSWFGVPERIRTSGLRSRGPMTSNFSSKKRCFITFFIQLVAIPLVLCSFCQTYSTNTV